LSYQGRTGRCLVKPLSREQREWAELSPIKTGICQVCGKGYGDWDTHVLVFHDPPVPLEGSGTFAVIGLLAWLALLAYIVIG
jgi:hypothetical protein